MSKDQDWYLFLSPEFAPPKGLIAVRDKVSVTCTECQDTSIVQVSNLKKQVKKLGTHLCRSCSARKATLAARAKTIATLEARYGPGITNPNQIPGKPEQAKKTSQERYGSGGSQAIAREAFKAKHKVNNPFNIPEIQERIKDTNIKKYGVASILELEEVRSKGVSAAAKPESRKKALKTFQESTGFKNPLDYNRDKIVATLQQKADELKKNTLPKIIENLKNNPESVSNPNFYKKYKVSYGLIIKWLRSEGLNHLINDSDIQQKLGTETLAEAGLKIADYIEQNKVPALSSKVEAEFGLSRPSIRKALLACGKQDLIGRFKSLKQQELYEYIKSLDPTATKNDRKVIHPSELDIALSSKKIGIEFNGLYWHSTENLEDIKYHMNKVKRCEDKGWSLIQINEDEWDNKPEIVKSIIKAKMGFLEDRVFARKCNIKPVDRSQAMSFCEDNHLMGSFQSGKNVGLFIKDELVSLIIYKKLDDGIDISRFCSKINTQVVGGLGKLLSHIENLERPKFIQSFVDLRYGSGSSLEVLGFRLESTTLGWRWTDFDNTFNRLRCTANMDERGLSQEEHAEELGWVKIYDAGQAKFLKVINPEES